MKQHFILKQKLISVIFVAFFLSMFCAGCGNGENSQSYLAASGTESAQEQETLASCAEGNHIWGEPRYTWSNNGSTCTAVRSCTVPGCEKTESETTEINKDSTAVFENDAFAKQEYSENAETEKTENNAVETEKESKNDNTEKDAVKDVGNTPAFVVSDVKGNAGDTVDVTISLANNPGIIAASLDVTYDQSKLKLVETKDAGLLAKPTFSETVSQYPYYVSWNDALASKNTTDDGILVTLTFEILKNAKGKADVSVGYVAGNVFDYDLNDVDFRTISGVVHIQ